MAASAGFYNKLYKVQEACPRVDKKATGQKNNKFAPLDEIMDKITPALKNQQLGIFHYLKQGESNTTLFCTQIYDKETSESVISTFPVAMPTMPDSVQKISPIMQGVGAISTYVKRYNISLLLNLIGTDPDLDHMEFKGETHSKKDLTRLFENSLQALKEKIKNTCKLAITDEQLKEYFDEKDVSKNLNRLAKFNLKFKEEMEIMIKHFGARLKPC